MFESAKYNWLVEVVASSSLVATTKPRATKYVTADLSVAVLDSLTMPTPYISSAGKVESKIVAYS